MINHLKIVKCILIGHLIDWKLVSVLATKNTYMVDAIMFISGLSIPISEDDLEYSKMIELVSNNEIEAVAEY